MVAFSVVQRAVGQGFSELPINFSGSGNNTVIAGVAGQITRVFKIFFVVGAASNVTPMDGATGLTGAMNFSANEGMVLDFDTTPWFTLSPGNDFVLSSLNAVQVSGRVYYTQGSA
jgi:hypothetical protein